MQMGFFFNHKEYLERYAENCQQWLPLGMAASGHQQTEERETLPLYSFGFNTVYLYFLFTKKIF